MRRLDCLQSVNWCPPALSHFHPVVFPRDPFSVEARQHPKLRPGGGPPGHYRTHRTDQTLHSISTKIKGSGPSASDTTAVTLTQERQSRGMWRSQAHSRALAGSELSSVIGSYPMKTLSTIGCPHQNHPSSTVEWPDAWGMENEPLFETFFFFFSLLCIPLRFSPNAAQHWYLRSWQSRPANQRESCSI